VVDNRSRAVSLILSAARLLEVMYRNPEHQNMKHSTKDAIVRTFGREGATLRLQHDDRWINCHLHSALNTHPSILFLHIGENDLENLTWPEIADC